MTTTATDTSSWNARLHDHPAPQSPDRRRQLARTAKRFGPVLAMYGTLKLIGFASFMSLLHFAGKYRTKNPRFGEASIPGTSWPRGMDGGTNRSPRTGTTPSWSRCVAPRA